MAMGYWTCESLVYDPETGKIITDRSWSYTLPQARDIPQKFNVYLKEKSFGPDAILGSKGMLRMSMLIVLFYLDKHLCY